MKKYKLLALTTVLALAGCATTGPSGEAGVESREPPRSQAKDPGPAVIPQGPLSAIEPSELSSQSVTALEPPPDLWSRIRGGFAMPTLDNDLVRQQEQWYASRPDYIQRMTDRSRKYLFHIVEELERPQHAHRTGAAALHRERVQSAGRVQRARGRHVAVHARHGQGLRPEAERLPRRPPRRAGVHPGRAGLPAEAPWHVRGLAPGARRLQLGRRQREPRHRAQPARGPGTSYTEIVMPTRRATTCRSCRR
jgi:hypothetical protein